jgi:hypothetical protein
MPLYHKPARSRYFDGPLYQKMSEDLQLTGKFSTPRTQSDTRSLCSALSASPCGKTFPPYLSVLAFPAVSLRDQCAGKNRQGAKFAKDPAAVYFRYLHQVPPTDISAFSKRNTAIPISQPKGMKIRRFRRFPQISIRLCENPRPRRIYSKRHRTIPEPIARSSILRGLTLAPARTANDDSMTIPAIWTTAHQSSAGFMAKIRHAETRSRKGLGRETSRLRVFASSRLRVKSCRAVIP